MALPSDVLELFAVEKLRYTLSKLEIEILWTVNLKLTRPITRQVIIWSTRLTSEPIKVHTGVFGSRHQMGASRKDSIIVSFTLTVRALIMICIVGYFQELHAAHQRIS